MKMGILTYSATDKNIFQIIPIRMNEPIVTKKNSQTTSYPHPSNKFKLKNTLVGLKFFPCLTRFLMSLLSPQADVWHKSLKNSNWNPNRLPDTILLPSSSSLSDSEKVSICSKKMIINIPNNLGENAVS